MTKIEWTEATWNPIVGCSIVSPGCTNCYAMKMAARIERMSPGLEHYRGLTQPSKAGAVWTGKVARAPDRTLLEPLRRKRPTMYFVNSMSDLFHEDVTDEWIDRILAVMALCPQHTFQVLTKRSARMRQYFAAGIDFDCAFQEMIAGKTESYRRETPSWPLPNVWLGVSAERQKEADERIPDLLATPAAVRFVSAEPLLGPIDFTAIPRKSAEGYARPLDGRFRKLDWIIVGGESGLGARPMHPDWARSIRDQCIEAGVPFFFKQWGCWRSMYDRDIDDPDWRICDRIQNDTPTGQWLNIAGGQGFHGKRLVRVIPFPKAMAGRSLDGREWNEMPGASKYDQALTDPHHGGKIPA